MTTFVDFQWRETTPVRSVMVRLVGLDSAYDSRELAPFLLRRGDNGVWSGRLDLPEDLRTSYQFCPVADFSIPATGLDDDSWTKVLAAGVPDPDNQHRIGPVYGNEQLASVLELPGAPPQPWCRRRPEVPRGTLRTFPTGTDWPAAVHIYAPPGRQSGPLPVVVLFDARAWLAIDVAATFDNLIADGVIAPFVAAMLDYEFGPVRVRGLSRPEIHRTYLLDELLPWLVAEHAATTDPARTVLAGQSLGGLAAVSTAMAAPERFGLVLAQSGSYWWPGEDDGELSGAQVIAAAREGAGTGSTKRPVRFWLEAGALETGLVPGNRELYAAVAGRGLPATYREYQGGHDFACWRGGLGDGLAALLG